MALNIKNPEVVRLAAEVADATGETRTQAVLVALQERLQRIRGRRRASSLGEVLREISRRCSALPDLDTRPADAILGYDEDGTFGD
jgi:antitoxin VapB